MKLDHEFYKLPLTFDVERLQQEVLMLDESYWKAHHEGFKGNIAVPLLSVNGEVNNDFKGPIKETDALQKLPYIRQVLASFNEVFGRSRLMALEPGCEVPLHTDINYHWYKRVRIHIPIVTTDTVMFHCNDKQVNMKAGECWIFDSWKHHKVVNDSHLRRIHLVIDTHGSADFWDMVSKSEIPDLRASSLTTKHLDFVADKQVAIATELHNLPVVMSPGELDFMISELKHEVRSADNEAASQQGFFAILDKFAQNWRHLWGQFGATEAGWDSYHQLRDKTFQLARNYDNRLRLSNDGSALQMLIHCIIDPALNVEIAKYFNNNSATITPATKSVTPAKTATARAPIENASSSDDKPAAPMSRNSPCPCGSGKKYKQCCGAL
ncbi:zinc chelation protein SecC [Thalassotalea sp. HSM 43]|uniref:aspartyl/asparaginyl beta-hydroxylase domain-containing protein n=1 Tax=Thalassotalea sp. HSM 43 TaxID=2552945 RepID=UPI0010820985|nr:aspartyl/asparaginyl beta-hydroxylase domain-containing protein [Thalassotalea sp. HSM 43]QBY05290.1 zinc chelation protein SecC [Thalassotalea sp. HSM 43]